MNLKNNSVKPLLPELPALLFPVGRDAFLPAATTSIIKQQQQIAVIQTIGLAFFFSLTIFFCPSLFLRDLASTFFLHFIYNTYTKNVFQSSKDYGSTHCK